MSELFTAAVPTEIGHYWVRDRSTRTLRTAALKMFEGDFIWQFGVTRKRNHDMARLYQFGPRIPPAEELGDLQDAVDSVWREWRNHHQIDDPDWEGYETMQKIKRLATKTAEVTP